MLRDFDLLAKEAASFDAKFKTYAELFAFPTLQSMGLTMKNPNADPNQKVNYLCGNSLGCLYKPEII